MSDDLPERLRIPHPIDSRHDSRDPLCPCFTCKQRRQAADRIDELETEYRRLKEAYEELSAHAYEEADVIKEQKAENERLRAENAELDAENDQLLAEAENEYIARMHER